MSWADWLLVLDAAVLAGFCVGLVWVGASAADGLRKRPPAVRRDPGHYGERDA